jgi:hypothetical protein
MAVEISGNIKSFDYGQYYNPAVLDRLSKKDYKNNSLYGFALIADLYKKLGYSVDASVIKDKLITLESTSGLTQPPVTPSVSFDSKGNYGDLEKISQLYHLRFKSFIERHVMRLSNPEITDLERKAISVREKHKEYCIPVIISLPNPGQPLTLPQISFVSRSMLSNIFVERDGLYFTPAAAKQYDARLENSSQMICDKATLDGVVCQIAQSDLFGWEYPTDGCYARSDYIGHFLHAAGVPTQMISKVFVFSKDAALNGNLHHKYHVATCIRLPDQTEWIIDPLIDPNHALSLTEWTEKLGVDPSFVGDFDRFLKTPESSGCFSFPSRVLPSTEDLNQNFRCIRTNWDQELRSPSSLQLQNFGSVDSSTMLRGADTLADYRLEIEKKWIHNSLLSFGSSSVGIRGVTVVAGI